MLRAVCNTNSRAASILFANRPTGQPACYRLVLNDVDSEQLLRLGVKCHVPCRGRAAPRRIHSLIDRLVDAGAHVNRCCVILGMKRYN
jgi:hypothetical protein